MLISSHNINSMFWWCINLNWNIKRPKPVYKSLLEICEYALKDPDSMTNESEEDLRSLRNIIKLILDGNSIQSAVSNVASMAYGIDGRSRRVPDKIEFFMTIKLENLDRKSNMKDNPWEFVDQPVEEIYADIEKDIENLIQMHCVINEAPKAKKIFDKLEEGFLHSEDAYNTYRTSVLSLLKPIREVDKVKSKEFRVISGKNSDKSSETLVSGLFRYDRSKKIPTGFKQLDDIMMGGFQPNRLYIFGGSSGSGKSTILSNMALNAARYKNYINQLKDKHKIFLYITLENDIEETQQRMYCANFSIDETEHIRRAKNDPISYANCYDSEIENNNASLIIESHNANSISCYNIGSSIEEYIDEYGGCDKCMIAAVYVDYLDLLKSDEKLNDRRFTLANITQEMKTLARDYHLPVITATQLNREAYKINSSWDLNAALVAESIDKVNICDFFALMAKNQHDPKLVHFRIGKFRSGDPDAPMDFEVNFNHFKFIDAKRSEEIKKSKTDEIPKTPFHGLEELI